MLRPVVTALALLAAAKIGVQEYMFRAATTDVIVATYQDRAMAACIRNERTRILVASPSAWANAAEIRLVIGKSDLDVSLWQVDNALWRARYRNAYLHLMTPVPPGHVLCEYDIANDIATVTRM